MNQEYWDQFARTGRVEDYLSYREKEVCKAKTEKYGDKCSESVNNNDRDDSSISDDARADEKDHSI